MDEQIREEYKLLYESGLFSRRSLFASFISPQTLRSPQGWSEKMSISREFSRDSIEVRRTLDEVEKRLQQTGQVLRSDAKFFLLINFMQMVAMPLRFTQRVETRELRDLLRNDIGFLVDRAIEVGGPRAKKDISAHAVIDALSRYWPNLKLSRFRLWED